MLRKRILWPQSITFLLFLLFDLGYRGLLFASMTSLKAGPRFAGIWFISLLSNSRYFCLVGSHFLAFIKNNNLPSRSFLGYTNMKDISFWPSKEREREREREREKATLITRMIRLWTAKLDREDIKITTQKTSKQKKINKSSPSLSLKSINVTSFSNISYCINCE